MKSERHADGRAALFLPILKSAKFQTSGVETQDVRRRDDGRPAFL